MGIRTQNRKKFERLRRICRHLIRLSDGSISKHCSGQYIQGTPCPSSEEVESARESLYCDGASLDVGLLDNTSKSLFEGYDTASRRITNHDASVLNSGSSVTDSSEDDATDGSISFRDREDDPETYIKQSVRTLSSDIKARRSADAVGSKEYDHLEPSRIFHAARLVVLLEAYALYDPEVGYCQEEEVLIILSYNSMDEMSRDWNNMAGQLDVWKLLDDAHDLVVTLHDKIEKSFHSMVRLSS